jgi:hypothetical protein
MDQRIFQLNLAVEPISLYLICSALTDSGQPISMSTLASRWTGSQESMSAAIQILERHHILRRLTGGRSAIVQFEIIASSRWKTSEA